MTGNEYYDNYFSDKIKKEIENLQNEKQKEVVGNFSQYMSIEGIMIRTKENYVGTVRRFLNATQKELDQIGFADYTGYMSEHIDKTSSYQIQIYTALKKFAEYLKIIGIAKENEMDGVKRPKSREKIETKEKREHNYLNKGEVDRLLTNVRNGASKYERKADNKVRDYFLIQLMLNTGLRMSAITKMDVNNIDKENNIIKIVEKRGKIRTCVLSEALMNLLEKWLEVRETEYNPVDSALFLTRKGTRLTTKGAAKLIEKYGEGIKEFKMTPHKLRATYGTMIYENTGDIYLTQKCMGHSNVQTTMLYVRGQEEKAQKKAAEIMSSITF